MNIDTSLELHIYRAGNGIKLLHPNPTTDRLNSIHLRDTKHTLGSMLELPLSVYFIGTNSVNQQVNEHDALLSGFDSVKNAIEKKCFNAFTKESASITTQNDQFVMQYQKVKISEEDVVLSESNISRPTLSIKLPWYNNDNKVIGLFGCSIILGQHPIAESLSIINKLGLLNAFEDTSSHIGTEVNQQYLSKRQLSCAKLLLAGMTQREIAAHLHLSPRTIETYLENIKTKLHCRNKTKLIIKLTELYPNLTASKVPQNIR